MIDLFSEVAVEEIGNCYCASKEQVHKDHLIKINNPLISNYLTIIQGPTRLFGSMISLIL